MGPIHAISTCLRKYVDFSGRAGKVEFWWFAAFTVVIFLPAFWNDFQFFPSVSTYVETETVSKNLISGEVTRTTETGLETQFLVFKVTLGLSTTLALLLVTMPFAAVSVRRLHDIGYPGWYAIVALGIGFLLQSATALLLIALALISPTLAATLLFLLFLPLLVLPWLALIVMLAWTFAASEPDTNEYGPNPHEVSP